MPRATKRYTPQEYYALERTAEDRSDFFAGEIFAMAGGSTAHSLIKVNLTGELRSMLKGKRCGVYDSDQRLKVKTNGLRCYPDAAVYCGPLDYDEEDANTETATNPTVIFEVLSKSTEAYDRGLKAESYRTIESLKAYVLISQDRPHVELQERLTDGTWRLSWAAGMDGVIRLPDIDVEFSLGELYDRVDFTGATDVATPA